VNRWIFSYLPGVLALAITLPSIPANAHETWLAARQHTVSVNQTITFDMTSGERFPQPGSAIARERIELAACRQTIAIPELKPGTKLAKTLMLSARPTEQAGLNCWVKLAPRKLDLAVDKVQEYLDDIDAPASVRAAWANSPEPKKWIEVYTKNAQVIVPVKGHAKAASLPAAPVGLNLEFVPSADLSRGQVPGPFEVSLLRDGKPLEGISVSLWDTGKGEPLRQRSDAQGKVTFARLKPGRWMLSATDLRLVNASQSTWESQFGTLVFEIRR
jgi:uncharacterized GH25 family protein